MENDLPFIVLMGSPNSGKTAIFNLLTGMNQKVSNYPGITVEQRRGNSQLTDDSRVEIMDMPGTYSLTPESLDEKIVAQQTLKWLNGINRPAVIISVLDAGNLSRNLYLTSQVMELGIPVIIAMNMMDRLKRRNQEIDSVKLQKILGAHAVIPMSAQEKWGINELQAELTDVIAKENSGWNIGFTGSVGFINGEYITKTPTGGSLVINTTPVDVLKNLKKKIKGPYAYDIVYRPKETRFLSRFKEHKRMYGIEMLIWQAKPCFEEWFGEATTIDKGLEDLLKEKIS